MSIDIPHPIVALAFLGLPVGCIDGGKRMTEDAKAISEFCSGWCMFITGWIKFWSMISLTSGSMNDGAS